MLQWNAASAGSPKYEIEGEIRNVVMRLYRHILEGKGRVESGDVEGTNVGNDGGHEGVENPTEEAEEETAEETVEGTPEDAGEQAEDEGDDRAEEGTDQGDVTGKGHGDCRPVEPSDSGKAGDGQLQAQSSLSVSHFTRRSICNSRRGEGRAS